LLVDTSVVVGFERRNESLEDFIHSLHGEEAALSSVTASELLVGVLRGAPESRRSRREAFIEYVLARLPVLPFDLAVARTHARLWTELTAAGDMIGRHDLMIAATAVTHGYAVLTGNVREFSRVPGLDVRSQDSCASPSR
jgi:predicted nucleic acid-binding protein